MLTLIVDTFFLSVSSLLKALQKDDNVLRIHIGFYGLIYGLCYVLCYVNKMGLQGLWLGWLLGSSIGSLLLGYKLFVGEMRHLRKDGE